MSSNRPILTLQFSTSAVTTHEVGHIIHPRIDKSRPTGKSKPGKTGPQEWEFQRPSGIVSWAVRGGSISSWNRLENYKYVRGYQLLIYIKIPKRPPSLLCNLPCLPAVMGRLFMQTTRNCLPRGSSKMEIACVWPSNLVLEVSVVEVSQSWGQESIRHLS